MSAPMFAVQTIAFGFALWLGGYLLRRNPSDGRLRLAGGGLIAYAAALALGLLTLTLPAAASTLVARLAMTAQLLPALFWIGAAVRLRPGATDVTRPQLAGDAAILAMAAGLLGLGAATDLLVATEDGRLGPTPLYTAIAALLLVALFGAVLTNARRLSAAPERRARGLLLLVLVFFGLSTGLLLLPIPGLFREAAALAVSLDLFLLGGIVAWLDALELGERLRQDMARSLVQAGLPAVVLGGQIGAVIALNTGPQPAMVGLLLAVVATAVALPVAAGPLLALVERTAAEGNGSDGAEPAALRDVAASALRSPDALTDAMLAPDVFARLTRRALSNLGTLPRLAASPLTRLVLVERRLSERGIRPDTLARARELRLLLRERIDRLKPPGDATFGTTDAWRHYNALYYPYVVGLRPYRRRYPDDLPDEASRQALAWLRQQVPERTLYNWQQAASLLIAQDLRDRELALRRGAPEDGMAHTRRSIP